MKTDWILTPQFFELPEPALAGIVPEGAVVNGPHDIADRSVASLARVHTPIGEFVHKTVLSGSVPVSVAGDCCAAIPVMAGLQAAGKSPVLVWLDAHGDFNTPETSPSGFLGGMPLAMMVGRGPRGLCSGVGMSPIDEGDVWLVDARDLDPGEREALEASQVQRVDMAGFGDLQTGAPVHLHIDIDVVDASQAPGTRYPVDDGPLVGEIISACRKFAGANEIVAISVSGWTGKLDGDGITRDACDTILKSVVVG
ncbi:Arginase [hydrothermal vent metagenome]|uniref:Arginase n=1 Tax=hydrothermal vent metagenome TaxID=652676 RepID=A0A3B0RQ23_9ZZZZ